ncbi:MAG: OmpA family protein [Sedimentisphaerales bacterium]|nr:OmpA family protein [Sedimentisphaerales bacterium]
MQTAKISLVCLLLCTSLALINGCGPDPKDLKLQNDTQRKRIAELESELQTAKVKLEQLRRKLETAEGSGSLEVNTLRQKIAALEEDLAKKKELISIMQQQLLYGGATLPVELSTMLEDFAKDKEMVEYDSARGIVKFKSDLLFEPGSDAVARAAGEVLKALCDILNTEQGKKFDVVIAGHTDDIRIGKPETRAKHPTNWHLSAHRAISVLNMMASDGISQERMSVRGFGEYRPITPNAPNKKGNPQNRRVEIFIVPQGM